MARILIAPTKNNQAKDKISVLLKEQGHMVIDSNVDPVDWAPFLKGDSHLTPKEAMAIILGDQTVKSAYADLERDMRTADTCLFFLPATPDASMMAGWFAARHKDVVGLMTGNGPPPLLAFMTTDLCLTVSEVVEAFSDR
ncbi:hypothetical protein ACQU0X_30895 [Pseudovibrio ascidiaceicola]|uniref:hypothetical protein n=1 Tax=Pseudovibrio ascidiaceicola TaxID=285279 RepID=UPI003D36BCFA